MKLVALLLAFNLFLSSLPLCGMGGGCDESSCGSSVVSSIDTEEDAYSIDEGAPLSDSDSSGCAQSCHCYTCMMVFINKIKASYYNADFFSPLLKLHQNSMHPIDFQLSVWQPPQLV